MKYFIYMVIILLSPLVFADSLFVEKTRGNSVMDEERSTITDLIIAHIEDDNNYSFSDNKSNSDFIIKSKVIKLDNSYILTLYKYKKKKRIHHSKMKAANFEEMDLIVSRLTRSLLKNIKPEETVQIGEITQKEESQMFKRRDAYKRWLFSMGPAWGTHLNASNPGINWGLGYTYGVNVKTDVSLLLHLLTSVDEAQDTSFYDISLGVNYHLSNNDNSPYLGGQIGYGRAAAHQKDATDKESSFWDLFGSQFSGDDLSGMLASATVGMSFFRSSSVTLGTELRYSQFFSKTKISKNSPGLTSLSFNIQF